MRHTSDGSFRHHVDLPEVCRSTFRGPLTLTRGAEPTYLQWAQHSHQAQGQAQGLSATELQQQVEGLQV